MIPFMYCTTYICFVISKMHASNHLLTTLIASGVRSTVDVVKMMEWKSQQSGQSEQIEK